MKSPTLQSLYAGTLCLSRNDWQYSQGVFGFYRGTVMNETLQIPLVDMITIKNNILYFSVLFFSVRQTIVCFCHFI